MKEACECFAICLLCDRLGLYQVLMEAFNKMWRSGKNVLTYREGKWCQLQRFRPEQLIATALDPCTTIFYEIEDLRPRGALDHRVSGDHGNFCHQVGWPGRRQSIAPSVGYSTCSLCFTRLGLRETRECLYRQTVERSIAALTPGCKS